MWLQLFLWIATFVLSDYFRERLPTPTPAGIGDFDIPTATEGRYVAIIPGGTVPINAPNCVWYGDFAAVERTISTGVIFKEDEVIGFTYELALQYVLFRGECFGITRVWIGDDEVFEYVADAGGVPATVVDIDRDDLFGGVDNGGGFVGRIRLFTGTTTQAKSAFLDSRLDPVSAYRGYSYFILSDVGETKGANIGESQTLRHIRVEVQTFSTLAQGGLGNRLGLTGDEHIIGRDANPVAVAYEIYLNPDWGRNFPVSDVNLTNFRTAASTVFAEGIGYSELIDGVTTTGALVDKIEQHVDAYVGPNPITGQVEITLARFDYVLANEFQATGAVLLSTEKWDKGDWSQTFNQLRVKYSDRNKKYKDTYALAQAAGNRVITGRLKSKDIEYPGAHDAAVANLLVARDIRGLAQPLSSGTLLLDRTAYLVRPGSVLSFTDEQAEETNLPVRVTKVTVGGPHKNAISCEVVQDVFDTEITSVADPPPSDFVLPVQSVVPFAVADQVAIEAPWIITKQDPLAPDAFPRGFTMARVGSGGSPTTYEVIRRTRTPPAGFSGGYISSGFVTGGFTTVGILRNIETAWQAGSGSLTMVIDPITGSLDFLIGTHAPGGVGKMTGVAVINPNTATEEWLAFQVVVDDGAGIRLESLFRACMDSGMHAHAVGDRVWFIWTGGVGLQLETFTPGDGVDYKFLPSSPSDEVLEPAATSLAEVSILDGARYPRPLFPSKLTLNGAEFPAGDVDADTLVAGSPPFLGVQVVPVHRNWRTINVVHSVQGLSAGGGSFIDADVTDDKLRVSWWLFDLDDTPTPVRGTDEIIFALNVALATAADAIDMARDDMVIGGITVDFNARLEIETSHEPVGFPAGFEVSREPLKFDFSMIGTWQLGFPYSQVSLHTHWDGVDATTVADDESNHNHTLTFFTPAQIDSAEQFFGPTSMNNVNGSVQVAAHASLRFGTGDFTIQTRARTTVSSGTAQMLFDFRAAGTDVALTIFVGGLAGQLKYMVAGVTRIQSAGGLILADVWYEIALCRLDGVSRIFIDGVQVGSDFTDTFDFTLVATLHISNQFPGLNGWRGWMDETRILKGVGLFGASGYTPETTEFFFHRIYFLSGFNGADGAQIGISEDRHAHTMTFIGNAQIDQAEKKFGNGSLLLDGAGDYVTVPDDAELSFGAFNFTVEGFMRFNTLPNASSESGMALAAHYNNTGNIRSWFFAFETSDELAFFWSVDGTAIKSIASTDMPALAIDTWYHVAAARQGTALRLFFNGVLLTTSGDAIGTDTLFDSSQPLRIGSVQSSAGFLRHMDGWLDEVRITPARAIYTAAFTPPAARFPRD